MTTLATAWQNHIAREMDLCCGRLEPEDYTALLEAVLADIQARLIGRDSAVADERKST